MSKSKYQKIWTVLTLVVMLALLLSSCGTAPAPKVYKVGILVGIKAFSSTADGFKEKMTELGYIEGENIIYDVQSTNNDKEAFKAITEKFVADKVDLIFAFPTEAALQAKAATQGTDIPVVFAMSFSSVGGLVDSISAPGGNITGTRVGGEEIASKRLDILLELAPNAKRIFVPFLKDYPNVPPQLDAIRTQAASKGIELIEYGSTKPEDLQAKLDSLVTTDGVGIDATLMLLESLVLIPDFYVVLGKFSYEHNLPIGGVSMSIGENKDYSTVFSLVPDPKVSGTQVAILADKIFRGTPAGTIPVVTAETYFVINYKAAQDFGLTVPEGLLSQADQVIK